MAGPVDPGTAWGSAVQGGGGWRVAAAPGSQTSLSVRSACSTGDTISVYLRALGNTAVLGRAQEARLAVIMHKGRALEALAARLAGSEAAAASLDLERLAAAAGLRSSADAAQVRRAALVYVWQG